METPGLSVAALEGVRETLLIPLAARASADTRNPDLGLSDPSAKRLLRALDTDQSRFMGDRVSMRGIAARVTWFDGVTRDFLARHPDGLCVNMGAGLDSRAERVGWTGDHGGHWVDVDLEEVVALRRDLIPELAGRSDVSADLTRPEWLDALPWPEGRPALFMAEGVFMYFEARDALAVIAAICAAAERRGGSLRLAFDYVSPMLRRLSRRHPSVGQTNAEFRWGLERPRSLTWRVDPRLCCIEDSDWIVSVSGEAPRVMGRLHRLFTGGRRLHGCALMTREPTRVAPAD